MKTFQTITLLFTIAAGISALPSENGPSVDIITDGDFNYTGQATTAFLARGLEARCGENYPPHSDCVIGQCQCSKGYGCYSCNGGRVQCQPGPNSGQCWQ
ncbi:hypothetical protein CONLIGDRAFT_685197 [Coniochaeta ligniaria NRRL 30616]|uniref:Uncharacterized protein n=1 Tax=Coniochaeta ligniaria NRRL 30616 TaxID=1408157 RepID=A0A1J7IDI0_9PEZI|nr:hypothetical protein CONLIGDRAFT_685197 [Coniochaeta ligniaria NRRL 30616]